MLDFKAEVEIRTKQILETTDFSSSPINRQYSILKELDKFLDSQIFYSRKKFCQKVEESFQGDWGIFCGSTEFYRKGLLEMSVDRNSTKMVIGIFMEEASKAMELVNYFEAETKAFLSVVDELDSKDYK